MLTSWDIRRLKISRDILWTNLLGGMKGLEVKEAVAK